MTLTIEEAKKRLNNYQGDDECFHSQFDTILEEKLMEYDPEFMKELAKFYDESGMERWCA